MNVTRVRGLLMGFLLVGVVLRGGHAEAHFRAVQITNTVSPFGRCINDRPAISADGTRIAFVSRCDLTPGSPGNADNNGEIFLLDTTTGHIIQITNSIDRFADFITVEALAINAAGTRVAFRTRHFFQETVLPPEKQIPSISIRFELFDSVTGGVSTLAGAHQTLTGNPVISGPAMNAPGTRIALSLDQDLVPGSPGNADHNVELFLFDTNTGFTQITDTVGGCSNHSPSMNADGSRIAFVSSCDLTPGNPGNADHNFELFLFDIATGSFTQITNTTGGAFADNEISMNAAGTRIAFVSDRDLTPGSPGNADGNRELFVFDTTTGRWTQLTNTLEITFHGPSMDATGTRIAVTEVGTQAEIVLFDTTTGLPTPIGPAHPGFCCAISRPSINAAGTRIAFATDRDVTPGNPGNADQNQEIFLAFEAVPGDFDGDLKKDLAVYRPATGQWFIFGSATGLRTELFGAPAASGLGDIPVPADFDGDGTTDLAIYRPATGEWFILGSLTGSRTEFFGAPAASGLGDIPVPADFDGDGTTDLAIYRPATGEWFIFGSLTGFRTEFFGAPAASGLGDTPVPADFDGDGTTDLAIYRQSTGQWFVLGSATDLQTNQFGNASDDLPVPADFDGDGKADLAVYRNSTGEWFVLHSVDGQTQATAFGASGDVPLP